MFEYGNQWTVTGEDGTAVTPNDGSTGITVEDIGGFDSPNIRTAIEDLPMRDGAVGSASYFGQRPFTLSGKLGVKITATARNTAQANLMRALRGLRSPCTISTTPSGMSAMQILAYVQSFRVSKNQGPLKDWQAQMIAASILVQSTTLHSTSATGTSPVNVSVNNVGNYNTPLKLTITGPVTNPVILDVDYTESITLSGITVAATKTCIIDTDARTILNDSVNVYSSMTFPASTWLALRPGTHTIRLTGTGTTGATGLQVQFRDAWA